MPAIHGYPTSVAFCLFYVCLLTFSTLVLGGKGPAILPILPSTTNAGNIVDTRCELIRSPKRINEIDYDRVRSWFFFVTSPLCHCRCHRNRAPATRRLAAEPAGSRLLVCGVTWCRTLAVLVQTRVRSLTPVLTSSACLPSRASSGCFRQPQPILSLTRYIYPVL